MNHTKILGLGMGLVALLAVGVRDARAILSTDLNKNIQLIQPTATPTLSLIRKEINLDLLPTATPTSIIVRKVIDPNLIKAIDTSTPKPTATKAIEDITPTITKEPTAVVTVAPTVAVASEKTDNNLIYWFLLVTIGLLAVIIVVQAWPKSEKKEEE